MLDKKKNKDKNSNYIKRKVALSLSLALATTSSIVLNSSNALIKAETLQEDKVNSLKSSTNTEKKDQDPSANIVFENPNKDDLQTLSDTLKNLPQLVENNKKINDMDTIGDSKNVKEGEAKKIKEFAGWTSVNNGDFIIARKTKDGIFPLSMINTTIDDIVWLKEQALDRNSKYMLLLTETRTRINSQLPSCDGTEYQYLGEGPGVARALKGYDGIEKTFKAYSKENGSFAKVSFKTGYTGDMDGKKANYKVEIFAISNGKETPKDPIYTVSFDPQRNISNDKMTVKKAEDGKGIRDKIKISQSGKFTNPNITRKEFIGKDKAEEEIAKKENRPNGTSGSFESAEIELPKGIDSYKVRISCADSRFTGMSYQAWDEKYALPITGLDFSITQNTKNVAKMLLSKIYDKLIDSKEQDISKKTQDSIKKYEDKLNEIKTLLDSTELKSTSDYQKVLNDVLEIKNQLVSTETMAINEIERVAKEKIEEIKNNKNLSEKEKNDIIEKINNKKQKAIEEIKKAKDNAEILQKQTSWVEEINKINPVGKEEAKNKIALELAKKEKEIDENTSLTENEKKSAKAKAKEKADAGLAVINEQKDSYDTKEEKEQAENKIKQATETAIEEIDKINPVGKEEAKNKIALELAKKEKEIDENTSLTENEKKSAKAKAKEKADAGLAVIDEQKDSYDTKEEKEQAENKIKQATETAVEEINKINPVAKEEARNKIALELAKKEKEIDENTSLTENEKKSAKAKAKEKADAGLAVIDEQKDSYDTKEEKEQAENRIKQATETAVEEINKINPVAKEEAKNKIALELAKKEKEIDENTSLTENEKKNAKAKAKEKADAGLAVIDEQKDSYDTKEEKEQAENRIKQATETAVEEINKINPVAKEEAKNKIALELAKKEKEIDENTSLTENEKKNAKAKAKEKADKGLAVINEQKDSYDTKEEKEQAENKIKQATETAIEEIDKINPVGEKERNKIALELAKKEARNKIALELAKKEKEIDENTSLTENEKKSAKAKAKEKADAGLAVIDEQKDSYDTKEEKEQAENKIKQATETAVEEINKINPVAKEEAKNKIALELAKKEKEIDENTSLTENEKKSAKSKAKEKADAGLAVIDEQKDSYDTKEEKEQAENRIKQATETAIEEIDKINPVGEEKNKSKKKSKKKFPKTSIASLPIYPKLLAISVTLLSVIGIKKRKK